MCIIVAKPKNTKMVEESVLKNCWENNSDGAGFMYAVNNRVYIQKGFMTYKSFKRALKRLGDVYSLDEIPLVMHFRISTQGGVNPQNTHPFPISANISELTNTKSSSSLGGMAHNGVIPSFSYRKGIQTYSDTLLFVKEAVTQLVHKPSDLNLKPVQEALDKIAQSKLSFLTPDGNIQLIGSFNYNDGVAFSNYSYYSYGRFFWPSYTKSSSKKSNNYSLSPAWDGYEYDYDDYGDPWLADYYRGLDSAVKDYRDPSGSDASSKKKKKSDTALPLGYTYIEVWQCDPEKHFYYDDDAATYYECDSNMFYDCLGQLWFWDVESAALYCLEAQVIDSMMKYVDKFPPEDSDLLPIADGYEDLAFHTIKLPA